MTDITNGMKVVRASEANRFENAATCVAYEYETEGTDINVARVEISGRYPVEGSAVNREVRELAYVLKGSGTVTVDGTESALAEGDVVSIERGERVHWDGTMTLLLACAPAWNSAQYEHVP